MKRHSCSRCHHLQHIQASRFSSPAPEFIHRASASGTRSTAPGRSRCHDLRRAPPSHRGSPSGSLRDCSTGFHTFKYRGGHMLGDKSQVQLEQVLMLRLDLMTAMPPAAGLVSLTVLLAAGCACAAFGIFRVRPQHLLGHRFRRALRIFCMLTGRQLPRCTGTGMRLCWWRGAASANTVTQRICRCGLHRGESHGVKESGAAKALNANPRCRPRKLRVSILPWLRGRSPCPNRRALSLSIAVGCEAVGRCRSGSQQSCMCPEDCSRRSCA
mmetsp:Transcript_51034/g.122132  ORF Transcript_51034/g.122132 Transcript_51034/m.122132 type:complete len:270 (+) Transcript_51034:377-1186(+)